MSQKIDLFISHSSNDVLIVQAYLALIEKAAYINASSIRCTSVDGYKLDGGTPFDNTLPRESLDASVFVAIVTENFLQSLYSVFEFGARWGSNKLAIPIIFGIEKRTLSRPISSLHLVNGNSRLEVLSHCEHVAKALGRSGINNVAAWEHLIDPLTKANVVLANKLEQHTPPCNDIAFDDATTSILKVLCEKHGGMSEEKLLARVSHLNPIRVAHALEKCRRNGIVTTVYVPMVGKWWELSHEGMEIVIAKKLI